MEADEQIQKNEGLVKMVEISVIIPIYNQEKYLSDCLDNIINQSFRDIEILCINDGSTDNSLEILEDYALKEERIRIITQENQGLAATRNRGIEIANGKYVYFIDSDDYLESTALEKLHDLSEKLDPDFIMFKLNNFDEGSGEPIIDDYYTMPHLKERVGDNLFNYDDVSDFALKLAVNVPGNFYNREFINDLRFPEGLLFEDNVFFTNALFKATKIYFYDEFLYHRRVRENSLSRSLSLDTIEITDILLDLCEEYCHPHHKRELYYRIFHNIYKVFDDAPEECKEDVFKGIKSRYKKFDAKWHEDDYFNNKLNPRYKNIFDSALQSDNHVEFQLRVELFEVNTKIRKLEKKNKKYTAKINKLKKENSNIKSTKGYRIFKR